MFRPSETSHGIVKSLDGFEQNFREFLPGGLQQTGSDSSRNLPVRRSSSVVIVSLK